MSHQHSVQPTDGIRGGRGTAGPLDSGQGAGHRARRPRHRAARLPEAEAFTGRQLTRIEPFFPLRAPARVLDVVAAQGVWLTALAKRGFEAVGVEPWTPAIEVSGDLAEATGLQLDIREGGAESLPFEDGPVDFVHANSVLARSAG